MGFFGGLVVVFFDVFLEIFGLWFGISGEIVNDVKGLCIFFENNVDYELMDFIYEEYEGYYLGYVNSVLWLIFYSCMDLVVFDNYEFKVYLFVNE